MNDLPAFTPASSPRVRAHALRVAFRGYLRGRGFNPCALDLEPEEGENGVAPASPLAFLLFVEWLEERPEVRALLRFV